MPRGCPLSVATQPSPISMRRLRTRAPRTAVSYWLQVVRDLAAADTEVARVLSDSPQLVRLFSHEVPAADALGTDETLRWQLFDAVAALLRAAAARSPLFLVLDDVHAAQESSM